jgi:hypothetical protein
MGRDEQDSNGGDHPEGATAISIERFGLGFLAFYALSFGMLALFVAISPSALVIVGIFLAPKGDPTIQNIIIGGAVVACLLFVAAIGYGFYRGTECLLRGGVRGGAVFLIALVIMHVSWVMMSGFHLLPINWFSVAIALISIILICTRWRRLFPTR